jgi:hypothetical protein
VTPAVVRRALAATAATAAVLALAGCGEDSGDTAAEKSAASTASPGGDDPTPSEERDEAAGAADGEAVSGDEFADLLRTALDEATTAHVTINLGGMGSGEGDADYTQTPPELAMRMSMDALGGDVEVRMVDGTVYLKAASFGGTWISVDLDDPDSPLGDLGGQLDPTRQFEAFADAVTEATYDGPDEVDGETLDHYRATVDTQELLDELPEAVAGEAGLPDTLEQEWWFDDEGRIRKFTSDFGGLTGSVELRMSDWGEDVSIEAPPSDEVTTMPGTGAA